MATDSRFMLEAGQEVFNGNELLVKGCLEVEGGVHLMTGYPGSPVAGWFDVMGDIGAVLKKKGVRALQANNEALSIAAINGSQMGPFRAIAAMKSVGVHVASDALAIGNLAGAHPEGGAVVICGDDPWCDSTQVPADSRFLLEHLRMPVVEPGTIQEMKDWIDLSFKLSRAAGLYIGYVVTTAQADGGGTTTVKPNHWPKINMNERIELTSSAIDLGKVLLPPRTWQAELKMPARHDATIEAARKLGINKIIPAATGPYAGGEAPLGFVTTGVGRPYLEQVLAEIGLAGHFPILNYGMSYPADVQLLAEFSSQARMLIVIEERRSFLEKNLRDGLFKKMAPEVAAGISGRMFGKTFPVLTAGKVMPGIPEERGLNPSLLSQLLIPLIQATQEIPEHLRNGRLTEELTTLRRASKPKLAVFTERLVTRTPTFCPGCPHRDSSAALLDLRRNLADPAYMQKHHKRGPVDMVAHGDTGCYTMLMFPPTEPLMHNYSGMGLGGGTGSGIDPFITNKQIVFMGDGTFFHSGAIAISNAIKAGQDITFIILENKTTAMTGHQEHAGTEVDTLGNRSYIQDIEAVVRGMKGSSPLKVARMSPAKRDDWRNLLEQTILADGVKVLIADKECGITYHRTKGKEERKLARSNGGFLPEKTHMNITHEVCENCLECTKATACPGLTTIDTDYGRKIDTDLTLCVNDGACERVRVSNTAGVTVKPCPSFEQVKIVRQRRKLYQLPNMRLSKLPDPTPLHDMSSPGTPWRVHMAGVGGMGIGVVGAIIVRAGHTEGHRVAFSDKKGLAIRNGGVYSQITFVSQNADRTGAERTPTMGAIPWGRADLLLGIDILEAARAVDPREQFRVADKSRTSAVLNLHKQATVLTLVGKDDFDPEALKKDIFEHCREESSMAINISQLCEQRLGSKQFANIMMLGLAFQLGLIPVSASSIAWAIRDTIRRDTSRNMKAFNIGRKLALDDRALPPRPEPTTWQQLTHLKCKILRKTTRKGEANAAAFEGLVKSAIERMPGLTDAAKYDLALRAYDATQFENHAFAKRYVDLVESVFKRDSAAQQYEATAAAIWNLSRVMIIKDEPYVSYLLTRYEKKQRDIAKFGVNVANGDRIVYRHHTSPEFNIGPWRIRLKITTTDWMLRIASKFKWLRKLPGWHKRESQFRDWYIGLLSRVNLENPTTYRAAVEALRCPEEVSGYREIRYPKQDAARERVEKLLANPPSVSARVMSPVLRSRLPEEEPVA